MTKTYESKTREEMLAQELRIIENVHALYPMVPFNDTGAVLQEIKKRGIVNIAKNINAVFGEHSANHIRTIERNRETEIRRRMPEITAATPSNLHLAGLNQGVAGRPVSTDSRNVGSDVHSSIDDDDDDDGSDDDDDGDDTTSTGTSSGKKGKLSDNKRKRNNDDSDLESQLLEEKKQRLTFELQLLEATRMRMKQAAVIKGLCREIAQLQQQQQQDEDDEDGETSRASWDY